MNYESIAFAGAALAAVVGLGLEPGLLPLLQGLLLAGALLLSAWVVHRSYERVRRRRARWSLDQLVFENAVEKGLGKRVD